jgi:hypothetical protein
MEELGKILDKPCYTFGIDNFMLKGKESTAAAVGVAMIAGLTLYPDDTLAQQPSLQNDGKTTQIEIAIEKDVIKFAVLGGILRIRNGNEPGLSEILSTEIVTLPLGNKNIKTTFEQRITAFKSFFSDERFLNFISSHGPHFWSTVHEAKIPFENLKQIGFFEAVYEKSSVFGNPMKISIFEESLKKGGEMFWMNVGRNNFSFKDLKGIGFFESTTFLDSLNATNGIWDAVKSGRIKLEDLKSINFFKSKYFYLAMSGTAGFWGTVNNGIPLSYLLEINFFESESFIS